MYVQRDSLTVSKEAPRRQLRQERVYSGLKTPQCPEACKEQHASGACHTQVLSKERVPGFAFRVCVQGLGFKVWVWGFQALVALNFSLIRFRV